MIKYMSPALLNLRNKRPPQPEIIAAPPAVNAQPNAQAPSALPSAHTTANTRAPGDASLVEAYVKVLQQKIDGHSPGLVSVPPQTVLGQWLELHRSNLEHPVIQGWMREQNIDPASLKVTPSTGAMTARVDGIKKNFSLADGSGWSQVAGPLLASGQIITPRPGQELRIHPNPDGIGVTAAVVAHFYGEPLPKNPTQANAYISRLQHHKSFDAIATEDPLRPANLRSAQALETQKANAEQLYSTAPQKLAYTHLATGVASAYPDVREQASQWAKGIIKDLTGKDVDPDTLFLNRFHSGQSYPGVNTATGYEHTNEEPIRSQKLPDALLSNFSEHDQDPGTLDSTAGIYTVGAGQKDKGGYGAHNEFKLAPSALMHASWKTDFQKEMSKKIDSFWNAHGEDYRTTLKGKFVQQARSQFKSFEAKMPLEQKLMPPEQQFSRGDYQLVMGAASNLPINENTALTVAQLQEQAPVKSVVRAYPLDINGWGSSDIIRFSALDDGQYNYENNRRDGTQVLYIPGAQPAFVRFDSLTKMDEWIVDQAKNPKKREALASHFSLYNRQDGGALGKSGVDSSLAHLANGDWSKVEGKTIDRNYVRIEGDVFSHMKDQAKERMTSDADIAIKSNSEVTRDTWLNDISAAAGLLTKLAPAGLPAAVAATATGITEVALGAEKTASGDTQAERSDGAWKTFDGALNTLFSAGASGKVEDPFAAPRENVTTRGQGRVINTVEESRAGRDLPNRLQPSKAGQISGHAVTDGDHLIANSTPNAKGIYQVKDSNGTDQWFIRYTDDTGVRKVYEIRSDFKLSDSYVQIIDPHTRNPVMTVSQAGEGEWVRSSGNGGWPWSRNSSSSTSIDQSPPSPIGKIFEVDGLETNGAEKIDEYLMFDDNVKYEHAVQNTQQVDGVVTEKKFQVSWSLVEDNFTVLDAEKAKPTPLGSGDYSDSFVKDIHRFDYSVINKAKPELSKMLSSVATTEDGLKAGRLRQFEEIVPDPLMRARISEVAHQGSLAPATQYINGVESGLRDGYYLSGGETKFIIEYDPVDSSAQVSVISKNPISNPDQDLMRVPGVEITTKRTFTIRESNEIGTDNNPYLIDKHAPSAVQLSVLTDI
jgi:hypothetical protein